MATEARQIAQALPTLNVVEMRPNHELASSEELSKLDLAKLPRRLTDGMIARLEAIVNCRLPKPAPCRVGEFNAIMAGLQACLPSQHRSDISLEAQAEAYGKMLGGYPLAAIKHLERQVLKQCRWFPTIAECITILEGFTAQDPLTEKRNTIHRRISTEHSTRFEEAMHRLSAETVPQAWIDALPDQWKVYAETRCLLWFNEDGTVTQRGRPDA